MKRHWMVLGVVLLAVMLSGNIARAQADEKAKADDIRKLLLLTGSDKIALQVMNTMIGSFKKGMPNVPEEFWTSFMKKVDIKQMFEMLIPIYGKHFTHEEIKGLIGFYETPLGKKVISVMPAVTQESMAAGLQWGKRLGAQVAKELQQKGYKK